MMRRSMTAFQDTQVLSIARAESRSLVQVIDFALIGSVFALPAFVTRNVFFFVALSIGGIALAVAVACAIRVRGLVVHRRASAFTILLMSFAFAAFLIALPTSVVLPRFVTNPIWADTIALMLAGIVLALLVGLATKLLTNMWDSVAVLCGAVAAACVAAAAQMLSSAPQWFLFTLTVLWVATFTAQVGSCLPVSVARQREIATPRLLLPRYGRRALRGR